MQAFPDALPILPKPPVDADLAVPGSKSLTNRALVVAALAEGASTLSGCLLAEDRGAGFLQGRRNSTCGCRGLRSVF